MSLIFAKSMGSIDLAVAHGPGPCGHRTTQVRTRGTWAGVRFVSDTMRAPSRKSHKALGRHRPLANTDRRQADIWYKTNQQVTSGSPNGAGRNGRRRMSCSCHVIYALKIGALSCRPFVVCRKSTGVLRVAWGGCLNPASFRREARGPPLPRRAEPPVP